MDEPTDLDGGGERVGEVQEDGVGAAIAPVRVVVGGAAHLLQVLDCHRSDEWMETM